MYKGNKKPATLVNLQWRTTQITLFFTKTRPSSTFCGSTAVKCIYRKSLLQTTKPIESLFKYLGYQVKLSVRTKQDPIFYDRHLPGKSQKGQNWWRWMDFSYNVQKYRCPECIHSEVLCSHKPLFPKLLLTIWSMREHFYWLDNKTNPMYVHPKHFYVPIALHL